MDPAKYQLLGGIVFAAIRDPGPMAIYPQWAAPTTVKMIDATFLCEKTTASPTKILSGVLHDVQCDYWSTIQGLQQSYPHGFKWLKDFQDPSEWHPLC